MPDNTDPLRILSEADPRKKAQNARAFRLSVLASAPLAISPPPDMPARPERPQLVSPKDLARRRLGSAEGRAALLHAIAHIELNAIDLAADMISRFSNAPELSEDKDDFIHDWSSVCDDEARHFILIADRLDEMGFAYGDFPAHSGLWDAARDTRSDIASRLAIAPLVLEARGLDVTPGMIEKLEQVGDTTSADILRIIYQEEIGHVAIGMKWFRHVAQKRSETPVTFFRSLVREHFKGSLRPPFNLEARNLANFPDDFYKDFKVYHDS